MRYREFLGLEMLCSCGFRLPPDGIQLPHLVLSLLLGTALKICREQSLTGSSPVGGTTAQPPRHTLPAPLKRGALSLYKILAAAWSLRHPKCFTLTRRSRRGTPYPPPSKEGGLPLCRIPVTAWRPRHPKRFALTFWGHWSIQIRSLEEKDLRLLFLLFRRCGRLQGQAARNRSGGSLLAAHIQVSVDIRCGCKIAMP